MEISDLDQIVKQWKSQLVDSDDQGSNPAGFVELFDMDVDGGTGSNYPNPCSNVCPTHNPSPCCVQC